MGLRSELAEHLAAEIGPGTFVYDVGEDVIAVPAIIIQFGDPGVSWGEHGQTTHAAALNIICVANRTIPGAAADQLEDMRYLVAQALRTFTPRIRPVTWSGAGDVLTINETDYMTATVEALARDTERGATIP